MRSPYLDILLHPLSLAMLALTVAAGLCAAWWLFPLGLLLWGGMFVAALRDPARRLNAKIERRAAALSPRFQQAYAKVERAQVRLFNTLGSFRNARAASALAPLHDEAEGLTDQVYALCQRMTAAENYLQVARANSDPEGERALAVLAVESAADEVVKREKQEALRSMDERLTKIKDIATLLDRVAAQAGSVAGALETLLADIVQSQALAPERLAKQAPAWLDRLRDQRRQVSAFEAEAGRLAG